MALIRLIKSTSRRVAINIFAHLKHGISGKTKKFYLTDATSLIYFTSYLMADSQPTTTTTPNSIAGGDVPPIAEKPKSEKELKKEAAKAAKLEKFKKKQEKIEQEKKIKQATSNNESSETKKDNKKKEKTIITYDRIIPKGQKKDVQSDPMPDSYSPKYVEAVWYDWWTASGFFKPEYKQKDVLASNPKGKFVMVIPPPNVTGYLHLGHALTNAIEDSLTRWHRMSGRTTLWNPGCDHAGISTQIVVEKKIWREQKKTRHDLGREKFVEEIWKWKHEKGDHIYEQLKKLGVSVDWDRAVFTMDPKMCRAVTEAFVRLHERSLIYRSKRMVNWCCTLRSVISDIEVTHIELNGRTFLSVPNYSEKVEFGVLHNFAYQIDDPDPSGPKEVIVATTRIETMLGDTAVLIHPKDDRYKSLHGKFVKHPFVDRKLPIVLDEYVDISFGTGAMKVTPAHDNNDYIIGERHQLDMVVMLTDEGLIAPGYGKFSGMKRFDCRKALIKELNDLGLYRGWEDNKMVVPLCERSKDIIEPMVKYQWYVNCQDIAKRAMEVVKNNELRLIPSNHVQFWNRWMGNIQDWCISRQNWWGHRIPVYFAQVKGEEVFTESPEAQQKHWFSGRDEDEARRKASSAFNVPVENIELKQDDDVLDTWFSSALFPFAVFGWPEQTPDLKAFYPGQLLETGQDILFFWVARMVMMSLLLNDKLPFETVYLHSIIRDAHGRKMSKSLGNVIDPLHVIYGISLEDLHKTVYESNLNEAEIERAIQGQKADFPTGIPECGTDALRFGLLAYTMQGRDINLDIKRIEGYRNFCNKLWNAIKFTWNYFDPDFKPNPTSKLLTGNETNMDRWILSCAYNTAEIVNTAFNEYRFADITETLYDFWLYKFCNTYLECIKPVVQNKNDNPKLAEAARQTLYTVCDIGLRLLHPLMPFITEELYQRLPRRPVVSGNDCDPPISICIAPYPNKEEFQWIRDEQLELNVEFMEKIVHNVRSLRAEYNLAKTKVALYLRFDSKTDLQQKIEPFLETISTLSYCKPVNILNPNETNTPDGCAIIPISEHCQAFIYLKGLVDISKETGRLQSKSQKLDTSVIKLREAMSIPDYENKVPVDVKQQHEERMKQLLGEIEKVTLALKTLSSID